TGCAHRCRREIAQRRCQRRPPTAMSVDQARCRIFGRRQPAAEPISSDLEHQGFDPLRKIELEAGETVDQQAVAGLNLETAAVLLDQLHALADMNQVEDMVLGVAGRRAVAPDPLLADRNEVGFYGAEGVLLDVSEKLTLVGTLNVHLQKILADHIPPIRERLAGLQVLCRPTLFEHCHVTPPLIAAGILLCWVPRYKMATHPPKRARISVRQRTEGLILPKSINRPAWRRRHIRSLRSGLFETRPASGRASQHKHADWIRPPLPPVFPARRI